MNVSPNDNDAVGIFYLSVLAVCFLYSAWFQVRGKTDEDRKMGIAIAVMGFIPGLQAVVLFGCLCYTGWHILTLPMRFNPHLRNRNKDKK
jgi:hypothetical protein